MPASKTPSKKRTPHACEMLCTKAVASDAMPKPSAMAGRNQPGPTTLQATLDGISKRMLDT